MNEFYFILFITENSYLLTEKKKNLSLIRHFHYTFQTSKRDKKKSLKKIAERKKKYCQNARQKLNEI